MVPAVSEHRAGNIVPDLTRPLHRSELINLVWVRRKVVNVLDSVVKLLGTEAALEGGDDASIQRLKVRSCSRREVDQVNIRVRNREVLVGGCVIQKEDNRSGNVVVQP